MTRTSRIVLAAIAALGLAIGTLIAEETRPATEISPEMQEIMKMAMPGKHHEHLGHMVGSWKVTSKMWQAPGQDPITSEGTMEARWVLGKRFVETITTGDLAGMPFEGRSLEGYDNIAGEYTSAWADNFGTYMMLFDGSCSNDGKLRTMMSETVNPTNGETMKVRAVTTVIDDRSYKFEMFHVTPEGEVQSMEALFERS
jgi:hypothetical protein